MKVDTLYTERMTEIKIIDSGGRVLVYYGGYLDGDRPTIHWRNFTLGNIFIHNVVALNYGTNIFCGYRVLLFSLMTILLLTSIDQCSYSAA